MNTNTLMTAALAALLAPAGLPALADKAAYDGFELSDIGALDGQIGGTGFADPYSANASVTVVKRSLLYANNALTVSGGKRALQIKKSSDASTVLFFRRLADIHEDTFYISALVYVDKNTKSSGNRDTISLGLTAEANARPHGGLGIEDTAYKWAGWIGTQSRLSTAVTANMTHLLVAKVFKNASGNPYNRVSLMVDPDSSEEPATWTLANQGPGGSTGTQETAFEYLSFFMNDERAEANDTFLVDEIRIGTTWADVVVPSADEPAQAAVETVEWSGGDATSDDWSQTANWVENASPAGKNAVFALADVSADGTANSVVSGDLSVNSLVFANLAAANDLTKQQVVSIPENVTLTVSGTNAEGRAFAVSSQPSTGGSYALRVGFTGGGALAIDSLDGVFIAGEGFSSPSDTSERGFLDFAGLSSFSANVDRFLVGYGERTRGEMTLAAAGDGANFIRASYVGVGDAAGVLGGPETSVLTLGKRNTIYASRINVGATEVSGTKRNNDESGVMRFAAGLENPTLAIRSWGGSGRADMTIASHGDGGNNWYNVTGTADFSGGTVDLRLGELLIAAGAGYTGSQSGEVNGYFTMENGTADINKLSVGRTCIFDGGRKADTHPAWGRFTMLGGEAFVNRGVEVGVSTNGSWKGGFQFPKGDVSLSGNASLTSAGPVILASDQGYATGAVARVTLEDNARLSALAGLRNGLRLEGKSDSWGDIKIVDFDGSVFVNGGMLAVTNAAQTSELCLDYGTLAVAGGSVVVDKLTMTNAESVVSVVVSGRGTPIVVNGAANVDGGRLVVAIDEDNPPVQSGSYTLIGAGSLTGRFTEVTLPQGTVKLAYTDGAVCLSYCGTVVLIR